MTAEVTAHAEVAHTPQRGARPMLIWRVDGVRYASPLEQMAEVVRAAAIVRAHGQGVVIGHLDPALSLRRVPSRCSSAG